MRLIQGLRRAMMATPEAKEPITDDHVPLIKAGLRVIDVIDIDYGYANSYHHTTQDTLDKLSPKSLQIVGDVVLQTIQLINQR